VEGPVKERLTGALILIAALVIVVPEMLSGPDTATSSPAQQGGEAGPPVRTYELQLDTPAATRSEDQSALSPQSATAQASPQAAPSQPVAADSAAAAVPAPAAPLAATKPAEKVAVEKPVPVAEPAPAPTAAAARGNWWVQLGSFSARENAERLGKQLRAAGYAISVSPIKSNGKELYRVRAGPVTSREAAAGLQSRLAAAGHKSSLVAP